MVFVAVLLAATTSAMGWFIYTYQLKAGYAKEYFARWQDYDRDTRLNYDRFLAQAPVDLPVEPEDPIFGPKDSKYTVVVFSDFLCPACQGLSAMLEQRVKEFPDQFRIVYKHFPLDTTCNQAIPRTLHPGACAAAVASEAMLMLKGNEAFWELHDALFHNKGKFTTEFIYQEAEKQGLTREEYLNRINTYAAWERVRKNIALGKKLRVESTPVMFFNGRQLKAWGDRHLWKYLVSDETLKATATQAASEPASQPATGPAALPASSPAPE